MFKLWHHAGRPFRAADGTFRRVRRLIVNADDLGLTTGVNEAIVQAHEQGILTSASLMAGGPAVDHAIAIARNHPRLGIGCHLTLVDGRPAAPLSDVGSLVDARGWFRPSWKAFILALVAGRISLTEVERELTAQINRLATAGVRLTHLDSHKHVHAYPPIFSIVAGLAARYGIPAVRVPFETPVASVLLSSAGVTNLAMWPWAAIDRRRAARLRLNLPAFTGRFVTGTLTLPALLGAIRRVPSGVTELMVHPGYADADLRAMRTRLFESRAVELAALCAPDARAAVRAHGITLVRHDLHPVAVAED